MTMWLYAIYCVGAFNACEGVYNTEANPRLSWSFNTQQECLDNGVKAAKEMAAHHPGKDIRWRCIDYSQVTVKQDK
jgi:hypothetical protein